jgi:hypothetical protein
VVAPVAEVCAAEAGMPYWQGVTDAGQ